MYIHTKVVYKIHEFSSYALKIEYILNCLHVRHKRDNAQFHKLKSSLFSSRCPQGCRHDPCEDPHGAQRQPLKCSMIEKYFKFPLCVLSCPWLQREKVLIVPCESLGSIRSHCLPWNGSEAKHQSE